MQERELGFAPSTNSIFNRDKTIDQYKNTPIFCGPEPGLMDTIHKTHVPLWALYKELKSLDWDEQEFDFKRCLIEFKTENKDICDMMIETIGWQWEADSVASRSILVILYPFISSTEYWTGLVRITDNEHIHAATYSEIIKLSFDDPAEVMKQILSFKNTTARMEFLENTLAQALHLSQQYAAKNIPLTRELFRDVVMKTLIAVLILERIQFMASFGVTFLIGSLGLFQPICKAVQKICQDELEIHTLFGKETIKDIIKNDEMAKWAFNDLKESGWMHEAIRSALTTEFNFIESLFRDGRSLPGANVDIFKQWDLFNAKDVVRFLDIELPEYKFPKKNPLPILETWIDQNKNQPAVQEQDNGAYKVGVVIDDSEDLVFEL
jgi:ribonucleoside-diphosphate reductase beta chain